ncbi:MAG: hypothetical protein U5K69_00160 [Balneolaceae bacterium]|nr:hypothetical protein [Balneolaceae bacterium]
MSTAKLFPGNGRQTTILTAGEPSPGNIDGSPGASSEVFGKDEFVFTYGRDVTEQVKLEAVAEANQPLGAVGQLGTGPLGRQRGQDVLVGDDTRNPGGG